MKKYRRFILIVIALVLFLSVLNITVSIQQCVNYQCYTLRLPLYLKVLDFFHRHYNYKYLVQTIAHGERGEEAKAMRIFSWTYKNIKRPPPGFPIIDDHIWYTIVRGYAAADQFCDIFTTLCNYAGIDAFFSNVRSLDGSKIITFSFVKINGKWRVFDPYNGNYFKNNRAKIATIEELRSRGEWKLYSLNQTINHQEEARQYTAFVTNLPRIERLGLTRSNTQSPFNRLLFQIRSLLKKY